MTMSNVLKQWEKAAQKFANAQEDSRYANVNKTIVKKRFRQFHGDKVLDLGCGYGYYTNYFNEIGANAIGVDGAQNMVNIAKSKYPTNEFLVVDLMKPLPFDDNFFDVVFCNQVLMDIESIDTVLSESYRILKKNGIFYYSIVHPAFYNGKWQEDEKGYKYAKSISAYLTPYKSKNDYWGETAHYHRSFSYYLNSASTVGFILVHTEEPTGYEPSKKNSDLPLFFFAEYKK